MSDVRNPEIEPPKRLTLQAIEWSEGYLIPMEPDEPGGEWYVIGDDEGETFYRDANDVRETADKLVWQQTDEERAAATPYHDALLALADLMDDLVAIRAALATGMFVPAVRPGGTQ